MSRAKKIGLYFGTFNPIHVGHLIIANYTVDFTEVDEVWLIVSPHNPLKKKSTLLDDHHRLQLVRVAIEDNPRLLASNVEFGLPQPSYTINTLAHLEEKYPEHQFCLIMGEDNLRSIHKWKNYEELLKNHEIFVYPRVRQANEGDESEELAEIPEGSVRRIDAPLMNISASFIREAIRQGHDVKYMLTEPVERYVREMHFYKS